MSKRRSTHHCEDASLSVKFYFMLLYIQVLFIDKISPLLQFFNLNEIWLSCVEFLSPTKMSWISNESVVISVVGMSSPPLLFFSLFLLRLLVYNQLTCTSYRLPIGKTFYHCITCNKYDECEECYVVGVKHEHEPGHIMKQMGEKKDIPHPSRSRSSTSTKGCTIA